MDIRITHTTGGGQVVAAPGFLGAMGATLPTPADEELVIEITEVTPAVLQDAVASAATALVHVLDRGVFDVKIAEEDDPHAEEQVDHGGNEDH